MVIRSTQKVYMSDDYAEGSPCWWSMNLEEVITTVDEKFFEGRIEITVDKLSSLPRLLDEAKEKVEQFLSA